jgi:Zn-dependent protease with chaperone function
MRRLAYTMRNLFRVSNIGTFVFFIINFLVLMEIFGGVYEGDPRGYLYLVLIYVFSILLSLAPTGQSALCLLWGARRITREDTRERILPLAEEVFERARREQPLMPHRIHIRVIREPEPNAYAIGIYTIGVTEGLLSLPDSQIQGILAHEMGHLALQHTLIRILFGPCNILMISIMAILELSSQKILSSLLSSVTGLRK